jgi:hypothetical protein
LRGRLQPFQAAQQLVNAGSVPFAATCRWYLSLVQLASDGQAGDKARSLKFTNCRAHGFSPRVRDPPDCKSIVALAGCDQTQAYQHPRDGGAMPPATTGGRYPTSVQFIRKRALGNEASRHKLPNGLGQSSGAGVCGLPERRGSSVYPARARRSYPTYLLH